jgi:uncharacterized membrane protein YGL010W
MKISKALQTWFTEYEKYHRNPSNKLTHYLGIPMILLSAYGLLAQVELFEIAGTKTNLALAALVAIAAWAMSLDSRFGLIFGLVNIPLYFAGKELSLPLNFSVFVAGWILQLVGHYKFEKKSPAFFTNLSQTLIGPMWILAKILGATGVAAPKGKAKSKAATAAASSRTSKTKTKVRARA